MIEELRRALEIYQQQWIRLQKGCKNAEFFEALQPAGVAWKVATMTEFDERFLELRNDADRIHCSWIDERWTACFHLKEDQHLPGDIRIAKIMQRRPNSTDTLGLDHVDFLIPAGVDYMTILTTEPTLHWTQERGDLTHWISVRFAETEAKLRESDQTSVDAALREWTMIHDEVMLKR